MSPEEKIAPLPPADVTPVQDATSGECPLEPGSDAVLVARLPEPAAVAEPDTPAIPPLVDVVDLDWDAIGASLEPAALRARMRDTVERLETRLDAHGGLRMLFDDDRASREDRAVHVSQ